jgi:hypothetical protein|tara:strand:+ start:71 stop:577 length:507 start_codon:yes stop_codon:yes gene_type:complete
MKLIQIDNFFDDLDNMLREIRQIKLYTAKDHPAGKMTYPGTRSKNLYHEKPVLWNYINTMLLKYKILEEKSWNINTFLHLRLDKDKDKDWIHVDETEDFAALIYLSETNLNSGTKIYDQNENIINDIKFVKNRFVMYSAKYKHMGYGHHGKNINDGRLTFNLFMKVNK